MEPSQEVAKSDFRVVVRLRPPEQPALFRGSSFASAEQEEYVHGISVEEETTIRLHASKTKTFQFKTVADELVLQGDFYKKNVEELVSDVLNGYNGAVVGYGAKGSGKSYTLRGPARNEGKQHSDNSC